MTLALWPAIDVLDGRCVRLRQGEFGSETVFGDPLELARSFVAQGAQRLHMVDLEAARSGRAPDLALAASLVEQCGVPVQLGGGMRDQSVIEAAIETGIDRVVVGTLAVEDSALLDELAHRWPGRLVVGLDHRLSPVRSAPTSEVRVARRELATSGWTQTSGVEPESLLQRIEMLPLAGIVVTDIARDGTGVGPDIEHLRAILGSTTLGVVASGGVASAADLVALSSIETGGHRLDGVVVGRALLSGSLSIEEALVACGR